MKRLDINKSDCCLVKLVFLSPCTEKRVTENRCCVSVQLIHIAGQGHEIHSDSVVLCVGCVLLVFNECGPHVVPVVQNLSGHNIYFDFSCEG